MGRSNSSHPLGITIIFQYASLTFQCSKMSPRASSSVALYFFSSMVLIIILIEASNLAIYDILLQIQLFTDIYKTLFRHQQHYQWQSTKIMTQNHSILTIPRIDMKMYNCVLIDAFTYTIFKQSILQPETREIIQHLPEFTTAVMYIYNTSTPMWGCL